MPKVSQVLQHSSSPISTFENPKEGLLCQSEIRALEQKNNSNQIHRNHNPPSTVSYQVVQFQEPKQESATSVMVTERGLNFKHQHSMVGGVGTRARSHYAPPVVVGGAPLQA